MLIKAAGVPIDRYSVEPVELLKDLEAHWQAKRTIRDVATFPKDADRAVNYVKNAPNARLYATDVSFAALADKAERDYLNQLPTTFVLPDEAVDRLRAAASRIILESPDFRRLLNEAGVRVVERPATGAMPPSVAK